MKWTSPYLPPNITLHASKAKAPTLSGTAKLTLSAAAVLGEGSEGLPTFEIEAYTGGVMYPNLQGVYYEGPVVVDIAGVSVADSIPVHREHDPKRPVGHASVALGTTIQCTGVFSCDNNDVSEIRASAKNGFPWRGSIGLGNMRFEFIEANQTTSANGQSWNGPILIVRESLLTEVSFVTVAGDAANRPAIVASFSAGVLPMDFAKWLAALGLDESTLSDVQKTNLRAKYDAEQAAEAEAVAAAEAAAQAAVSTETDPAAVDPAPAAPAGATATANARAMRRASATLEASRAVAAAEEERIAAIREIGETIGNPIVTEAGANGATLVAHAIRQGWDSGQTALYATRASRPRVPAGHSTSQADRGSMGALQAATMLRASRPIDQVLPQHHMVPHWQTLPVNHPDRQRVMDSAQEFRNASMMEMTALALRASGHTVPSGFNHMATLQAAFSTGSVAALYEQSIGSMAIGAYVEVGDFSAGWTSENDELNLEEHTRPRLASAPDLTLHPETGEADQVSRSATAERVKVDRYSRQIEIDEIAFINDNFQELRNTPADMGRAAARLRPTMVAAVLMGNAALADNIALFHADHGNLITTSALAQATLRAGRARIARQMDGDTSINLPASHLIVPTDLGDLAIQLTGSAVITNDGGVGGTNPIRMRNLTPVEEARLANGVVDPRTKTSIAGSATRWYLVSAEGHTIEVQFLQGTGRVPVVVVTQLTGGKFGLNITVKHFVGAKALDFRAMLRADA